MTNYMTQGKVFIQTISNMTSFYKIYEFSSSGQIIKVCQQVNY